MHLIIKSQTANPVSLLLVCEVKTEERLQTTCFRGHGLKLAGNFKLWKSVEDMFLGTFCNMFVDDIWTQWNEKDFGVCSVTFQMAIEVGWESTLRRHKCLKDELEVFAPNKSSTALRIRKDLKDRLAPLTRDVTVIYELCDQRGEPKVTIRSLYPGTDIGELDGDITEREGRVFFDWNHPGE